LMMAPVWGPAPAPSGIERPLPIAKGNPKLTMVLVRSDILPYLASAGMEPLMKLSTKAGSIAPISLPET
jgi:hypothetical protein